MPDEPLIDIDALAAPVAGDSPAGEPLSFKTDDKLDLLLEGRKWDDAIDLAADTLREESKDLWVVARMLVALTRRDGFAGARDGFRLMARLLRDCWDRCHPVGEDGETPEEARSGVIGWLNDGLAGAKYPTALQEAPLLRLWRNNQEVGSMSYLNSVSSDGATDSLGDELAHGKDDFEAALPDTTPELAASVHETVTDCQAALKELGEVVLERFGSDAADIASTSTPNNIGSSLDRIADKARQIAQRHQPDADEGDGGEESGDSPEAAGTGSPAAAVSRDGLYRQIEQIADRLEKLDRHSPTPHLLRRVVKLGNMPFPDMIRDLTKDGSLSMDDLDYLLGVERPSEY